MSLNKESSVGRGEIRGKKADRAMNAAFVALALVVLSVPTYELLRYITPPDFPGVPFLGISTLRGGTGGCGAILNVPNESRIQTQGILRMDPSIAGQAYLQDQNDIGPDGLPHDKVAIEVSSEEFTSKKLRILDGKLVRVEGLVSGGP